MSESMTFADAAYRLLIESGEPRHYRWLAEEAIRQSWIATAGKTPAATVSAVLHMEMKNEIPGKRPSRFVKSDRGMFGLAEWQAGTETAPSKAPSAGQRYFVFIVNEAQAVHGRMPAREIYDKLVKTSAASCEALRSKAVRIWSELIFMLQSHVELCCIGSNIAHKLQRHTPFLVEVGSPERTHVATTNNKLIRLWRISAFLPPASWGVSTGELL